MKAFAFLVEETNLATVYLFQLVNFAFVQELPVDESGSSLVALYYTFGIVAHGAAGGQIDAEGNFEEEGLLGA